MIDDDNDHFYLFVADSDRFREKQPKVLVGVKEVWWDCNGAFYSCCVTNDLLMDWVHSVALLSI